MSKITKYAMAAALKELTQKKNLSKITISDITDKCGISRMTFYYHFKDIYDLVGWICNEDAAKAIGGKLEFSEWQKAYTSLGHLALENRVFVENVYHSMQKENIERYMNGITYRLLVQAIEEFSKEEPLPEEDVKFIANFFKHAFVGIELDWVRKGMKETPEDITDKLSTLIDGELRLAIKNFQKKNRNDIQL